MTRGRIWFLIEIFLAFLVMMIPVSSAGPGVPRPASYYIDAALSKTRRFPPCGSGFAWENAATRVGALDDPKAWIGVTNVPVRSWCSGRRT